VRVARELAAAGGIQMTCQLIYLQKISEGRILIADLTLVCQQTTSCLRQFIKVWKWHNHDGRNKQP